MGYVLPWGQMSYWGAQVIINLFGTIPFIGPELTEWIRGDYLVADATLNQKYLCGGEDAIHPVAGASLDGGAPWSGAVFLDTHSLSINEYCSCFKKMILAHILKRE